MKLVRGPGKSPRGAIQSRIAHALMAAVILAITWGIYHELSTQHLLG